MDPIAFAKVMVEETEKGASGEGTPLTTLQPTTETSRGGSKS